MPARHPAGRPVRTHEDQIVLWRLRGAEHELVCTTIVTTFGYALHLTLAGEPILLELQRTVDQLTAKADRLETWLREQGWTSASQTDNQHSNP